MSLSSGRFEIFFLCFFGDGFLFSSILKGYSYSASPFSNDGSAYKVVGIYVQDPVPKSFLIISETLGFVIPVDSVFINVEGSPFNPGPLGNLGAEL